MHQLRLVALCLIATASLAGLLSTASCRRVPQEIEGWNIPTDFVEHQASLRTLALPREVTRFDWLSTDLEHLEAQRSTASVVRGFPGHLESLDLSYSEVRFLAGLPDNLKRLDLRFTNLTRVPDLPAGLDWLALGGDIIRTLDGIPPDLRELVLLEAPQLIHKLPPNLKALTLIGGSFSDLRSLPPSLQSLTLKWTGIKTLPALPDSLQSLTLEENRQLVIGKSDLPQFLTTLSVKGTALPDISHLSYLVELEVDPWDSETAKFPLSLRTLRVTGDKIPPQLRTLPDVRSLLIRNSGLSGYLDLPDSSALPAELETLALTGFLPPKASPLTLLRDLDLSWMQIDMLPSLPANLETLDISATAVKDLTGLPENLSTLQCSRTRLKTLAGLPQSIVNLDLSYSSKYPEQKDVKVPNLLRLSLRGTPISELAELPRSILALDVSETQVSSLKGAPPKLQELTVSSGQIRSLADLPGSVHTLRFTEPLVPNDSIDE